MNPIPVDAVKTVPAIHVKTVEATCDHHYCSRRFCNPDAFSYSMGGKWRVECRTASVIHSNKHTPKIALAACAEQHSFRVEGRLYRTGYLEVGQTRPYDAVALCFGCDTLKHHSTKILKNSCNNSLCSGFVLRLVFYFPITFGHRNAYYLTVSYVPVKSSASLWNTEQEPCTTKSLRCGLSTQ
jgi:hypothetical protein